MKRKFINEIEGFEECKGYSVTTNGDVYSHFWRHDKIWEIREEPRRKLKATKDKKGYMKLRLSLVDKKKSVSVHRLVALAFIPNPDNKLQVNHIDGNKENNNIDNLEWVTNDENHKHKLEHGLNVSKSGDEHYTRIKYKNEGDHHACKIIIQCDLYGNEIKEYVSVKSAGEILGIDRTSISKALKGHIKTAGGFIWKYKI